MYICYQRCDIAQGRNVSKDNGSLLNMASESNRFHKLKGRENYDTWKISAKSYLVIKKSWSCIENGLASDASDEQRAVDLTAWSELILLIEESIYSYIAETTSVKEAWTALQSAFEDSGLCRKVSLLKQLVQLKLGECTSIEDYVNRVTMTSLKVKKAGLNLDDEIIASLMLAGLPNEFNSLVMAIENSSKKLTTDGVKTLLLQETRFDPNEEGAEAFFTRSSKEKKNNFRCHKCGLPGHFAKYCPQKKAVKVDGEDDDEVVSSLVQSVRRGNAL